MMKNRRNYYRILHVQPDAPPAVIKASYRTLLQKLRMHPDLGGDHWNASLLNEAYAVLSDPVRREAYAKEVHQSYRQSEQLTAQQPCIPARAAQLCPFCKTQNWSSPVIAQGKVHFCCECESPLPNPEMLNQSSWQRAVMRIPSRLPVHYYTYWPTPSFNGQLKNVSPTGACLLGKVGVYHDQVLKLECPLLRALCKIVRGQPSGIAEFPQEMGIHFLSAAFKQPRGTFLSLSI